MESLGPVVQELGSVRQTKVGRATRVVTGLMGGVSALILATGALILVVGILFAAQVDGTYRAAPGVAIAFAVIMLLVGLALMGFAFTMSMQLNRTTATIHAHGLDLGQSWFRKAQVHWSEVAYIEPPDPRATWVNFHLVLRSGARVNADRLRLKSESGHTGPSPHHPDVQAVLAYFAAWRRQHTGAAA